MPRETMHGLYPSLRYRKQVIRVTGHVAAEARPNIASLPLALTVPGVDQNCIGPFL